MILCWFENVFKKFWERFFSNQDWFLKLLIHFTGFLDSVFYLGWSFFIGSNCLLCCLTSLFTFGPCPYWSVLWIAIYRFFFQNVFWSLLLTGNCSTITSFHVMQWQVQISQAVICIFLWSEHIPFRSLPFSKTVKGLRSYLAFRLTC